MLCCLNTTHPICGHRSSWRLGTTDVFRCPINRIVYMNVFIQSYKSCFKIALASSIFTFILNSLFSYFIAAQKRPPMDRSGFSQTLRKRTWWTQQWKWSLQLFKNENEKYTRLIQLNLKCNWKRNDKRRKKWMPNNMRYAVNVIKLLCSFVSYKINSPRYRFLYAIVKMS